MTSSQGKLPEWFNALAYQPDPRLWITEGNYYHNTVLENYLRGNGIESYTITSSIGDDSLVSNLTDMTATDFHPEVKLSTCW
jgi:hypothetical protein